MWLRPTGYEAAVIGYTMVGTTDLARAGAFYDAVFAKMQVDRLFADEKSVFWGRSAAGIKFAITLPFDGEPAAVGNGVMIALRAKDREEVEAVHRTALSLGAKDEGAVGPRGEGNYFGGYFRDLDGNKLAVFVT